MDVLPISKTIKMSDAGFNEEWLQSQIWENPSQLGLGDLETVTRETAVSSGGRLDILLKNSESDTMYEVEVMLGETDPSHIIRTIEYWDLTRRKWPQRQHFGVLIAEKITRRYFNVIQILSNNVPLVAIQANIIEIEDKKSLHFTKILDAYEEPEDDLLNATEQIDEAFWQIKSISVLNSAKRIYDLTKGVYEGSKLGFNKTNITISSGGYNQMYFKKRYEGSVLIVFRFGSKMEDIEELLQNNGINFTVDNKKFKIQLYEKQIEEKLEVFLEIAKLNKRWWQE